jgi:hypothetical protein
LLFYKESQVFSFHAFWIPAILMGVGIAIDVAIATIVMFRDEKLSSRSWTLPIMSTHILFPGIGYYLVWGLGAAFTPLQVILGFAGAALVAAFLYEATTEWRGKEPIFAISDWMSRKFEGRGLAWLTPSILAVSWDALWSGPAKAAQAMHWSTSEVLLSFLVAGFVVAVVAQLALAVAFRLRNISFSSVRQLATFNLSGKFGVVSVIGGFGLLALWNGVDPFLGRSYEPDLYVSIAVAGLMAFVLFVSTLDELWRTELKEVRAAIG